MGELEPLPDETYEVSAAVVGYLAMTCVGLILAETRVESIGVAGAVRRRCLSSRMWCDLLRRADIRTICETFA